MSAVNVSEPGNTLLSLGLTPTVWWGDRTRAVHILRHDNDYCIVNKMTFNNGFRCEETKANGGQYYHLVSI